MTQFKDPLIWTKEKVLSPKFCEHVIAKFEKDDRKHPGKVGKGGQVMPSIKQSTDLNISNLPEWKEEDHTFYVSLMECLEDYYSDINQYSTTNPPFDYKPLMSVDGASDSGYQIQRTRPGYGYHWHSDAWIQNNMCRAITYIWYLNDVYNDGYTEFSNGMKIQPKQGKILLFPATWTYVHRGYPPKIQLKYICTGWISHKLPE